MSEEGLILVAVEDPVVALHLRKTLRAESFPEPALCRSSEEARRVLAERKPVAAIVDADYLGADPLDVFCPVIWVVDRPEDAPSRGFGGAPGIALLRPLARRSILNALEKLPAKSETREALSSQALNSLPDGVITTDLSGHITCLNQRAGTLCGVPALEAIGRRLEDVFHVERGDVGGLTLVGADGTRTAISDSTALLKDSDGALNGLVVQFRAAEEGRALAERALGEWRYPVLSVDAEGKVAYASRSAARFFDRDRESILGFELKDILPGWMGEAQREEFLEAVREGGLGRKFRGKEPPCLWDLEAHDFGEGRILELRDVTEAEKQRILTRRVEAMDSLSLLARGFAHDFNNLFTVLLGSLSLARTAGESGGETLGHIQAARDAAAKAQGLAQQIQVFAQGSKAIRTELAPSVFLRAFQEEWPERPGLEYRWEWPEDFPLVLADTAQIKRLLSNLILNAEQAVNTGGNVIVKADWSGEEADSDVTLSLQIEDDGPGIPEDILGRVKEPFFTTRRQEFGSGLGLAVSDAIVRGHGGRLKLTSRPGEGTVALAIMRLSRAAQPIRRSEASVRKPEPGARLLILEDEVLISKLMASHLQQEGWNVTVTVDGQETLRQFEQARQEGRPFAGVILDLSIPGGMGGLPTLEHLQKIDPNVRSVISSGYSDEPVMAQPQEYGVTAILPKPYEPSNLVGTVAQAFVREPEINS